MFAVKASITSVALFAVGPRRNGVAVLQPPPLPLQYTDRLLVCEQVKINAPPRLHLGRHFHPP
jgi:hypothetical protein